MKKTTAKRIAIISAVLYPFSYLVLSLAGYYQPTAFGAATTSDGRNILRPKFGYAWTIRGGDYMSRAGYCRAIRIFYAPLLFLDQKFWHTRKRAETMRYPIRDYYDRELENYRDHRP